MLSFLAIVFRVVLVNAGLLHCIFSGAICIPASSNMVNGCRRFDVDSSEDVWIHDCDVSNGDDCVAVGSESRNVMVERLNCTFSHGLSIGSVNHGNVSNVTFRDSTLTLALNGARIKTWSV